MKMQIKPEWVGSRCFFGRIFICLVWWISHFLSSCVYLQMTYSLLIETFKTLLHVRAAAAAAKLLQSCPTLCDPIDGSPPGSAVPGILQARTLEWVAIAFSIVWKWKVKVKSLSRVRLIAAESVKIKDLCISNNFRHIGSWLSLLFRFFFPFKLEKCLSCFPPDNNAL